MARTPRPAVSGRHAAALALAQAAARFPDLPPSTLRVTGLSAPEAALALAIHRTALQRWLTLEHLLDRFSSKPVARLEPALRAVLLAGAAQLLFMPGLPAYAAVDESVALARRMVRPGAAGMANAILRKLGRIVGRAEPDTPWTPAANRLPLDQGSLLLAQDALPSTRQLPAHLAVATSHPAWLVRRWIEAFGPERTLELCRHGVLNPPTTVAVEESFDREGAPDTFAPHAEPGFIVWQGAHEPLVAFLAEHPARRVQDPSAARPVASCRSLGVVSVLDYCAGRGTKTRQLAVEHPRATILASDPSEARQADLRITAERYENVHVLEPEEARSRQVDLLVLDVPCSNAGVLARRPEARYRLSPKTLSSVAALQRQIVSEALPAVKPGGHVLYSTCSIEQMENQAQAKWLIKQAEGELVHEDLTLPAGDGPTYHDGSYHALVRLPGG